MPAIARLLAATGLRGGEDRPVADSQVAFGEVGLTGEIRPVPRVLQRVREAANLGFNQVMIPWANVNELQKETLNIKLVGVKNLSQAMEVGLQ